jgi:uncharacterized protein (UPF0332 family)
MSDAEPHIVKTRESLKFARYALAGEYTEEAGRSAYMAAYHAALAFIVARTSDCYGGMRRVTGAPPISLQKE